MAEYTIAGIMHVAKGLPRAVMDREAGRFDHRAYRPLLLQGKTVCVVGAGGIGLEVGRLCAALGMKVVGTRRHLVAGDRLPEGFSLIGGPGDLDELLPKSDIVVIAAHWTPETTHLFNADRFALMKPGAILANVARGEIVDELALVEALKRDDLRGVVLDVYTGEFERAPLDELWSDPRVLITPHISGMSDQNQHRAIDIFCENLRAYIDEQPLKNVIEWERGY